MKPNDVGFSFLSFLRWHEWYSGTKAAGVLSETGLQVTGKLVNPPSV